MTQPILIDTDPGHDDLVAIILAAVAEQIELKAITTVSGNAPVDKTTDNALRIVDYLQLDVPVYGGCARSLTQRYDYPSEFHGVSGMDSAGADFPATELKAQNAHAVSAIIDWAYRLGGELTLVAIGPLTNVASALVADPRIAGLIREVVIMGGSLNRGNITPAAEFNIWADPRAAQLVFESGVPVTLFGLNVTEQANLKGSDIDTLTALSAGANPIADTLRFYFQVGQSFALSPDQETALHDACTLAYLIDPSLFRLTSLPVAVVDQPGPAFGMTVFDQRPYSGNQSFAQHIRVAVEVKQDAYRSLVMNHLERVYNRLNEPRVKTP